MMLVNNIFNITKGKKVSSYSDKPDDESLRYLQIDDLRNNNQLKYTNDITSVQIDEKDVIIAWDGANVGTIGFRLNGIIGSTLAKLSIKEEFKDKCNSAYLGYFLSSKFEFFQNTSTGATIPHLSRAALEALSIPLPELEIQNKIVSILDKVKIILEKREETIQKYDELQKAIFLDMFGDPVKNEKGWEQVELIDICTKITDGTHKTPKYLSKGIKFISAKNIKKNSISWSDVKYISEAESNSINLRCNPEFEDILLTKSGSLGQPAIVDVDFKFTLFESLALIKYNRNKVIPPFLITYLMSDGVAYFYRQRHKGVAIKHLHLVDIKSIPVYLPPIELQNEFGEKYYKIKNIKNKLEISFEKFNLIKKALSQLAFKGELNFNTAVDLEVLLENDYAFFTENSSQETIKLLLKRLDKDELNDNTFNDQRLYDKAKEFVFELLSENKIKQVFDDRSKRVKLNI